MTQHEQWTQTHRGSYLDLLASLKHHMRWYFRGTKRFLSEEKIKKTLKTFTKSTKSPLKWRAWRARLATREFLTPPVSVCVCLVCVCISQMLSCIIQHGCFPKQTDRWRKCTYSTGWVMQSEQGALKHWALAAERRPPGKKQSAGTRARAPRAEGKCYRRCGYLIRAGSFRIESHQRGE